jgi:hypothetical protein
MILTGTSSSTTMILTGSLSSTTSTTTTSATSTVTSTTTSTTSTVTSSTSSTTTTSATSTVTSTTTSTTSTVTSSTSSTTTTSATSTPTGTTTSTTSTTTSKVTSTTTSTTSTTTSTTTLSLYTYNNQTCTSSSQCKTPLICNLVDSSCNCPNSVTINKCDCPRSFGNEYYWNGTTCVVAGSYNKSCTVGRDYTCQTITQNTICDSTFGKCLCDPTYARWNSSVCLYCRSNWVLLRNSCFIGSSNATTFSNLTSSLISSYCFKQPSVRIANLINTDSQLTFFLTNRTAFPITLYYFNSYRIGNTQTFQSGTNILNVVYPYWRYIATDNCTIFDTYNLYFYDYPCQYIYNFICEYVLI